MEKQKIIPALRFPSFRDDWQLKKFGSLTKRISNPVIVDKEINYKQIGIRSHGKGIFHKDAVSGKSLGNKRVFWIKENAFIVNIVFAWEQAVAKTTENEIGMIASHRFPMYLPIENQSDLDYLLHFFLTKKGKNLLGLASPGGAGRNKTLGQKELENLKLLIPSVPEQIKIATFLSAVNEKLTELKVKKILLTHYRKGVLQKIFSQKIRFNNIDGTEFPEWTTKKLSDVATKKSSNISANKIENNYGEYIIYGASGVLKKVDFYKEENDYISIIKDGAGVGRIFYCKGKTSVLGTMEIIKPNSETNTYFLYCLLSSIEFEKYITGSTIPHIYFKDYSNEICGIPCIAEQVKIANFLSALDEKINHCQNQIEKTATWKKGLLQKMLV